MSSNSKKRTVSIQSYLDDSQSVFAAFQKRANELQLIHEKIKTILPSPLCDHCVLANVDKNRLTLHTDSSAWAARLRFKTPEILSCLKSLFNTNPPKTIRIRVVPPVNLSPQPKRKLHLSDKNAQLILDTANLIKDPELREALVRLSGHKS